MLTGALTLALVVAIFAVLLALPLMWVWNWIVPQVLPGLVQSGALTGNLNFFQALGVALLAGMLFKGGSFSNNGGSSKRSR
jgi:ABC-type multidrug transport system fused ATPase/permease subunit